MAPRTPSPRTRRTPKFGRGRSAESPGDVPAHGWRDIARRTRRQLNEDNLSIVAAGVAFFAFLAVVPAMVAVIGFYGLIAEPAQVASHIERLQRVLPPEAVPLVQDQMMRIASNQPAAGWSAAIGLVVALFSSLKGTKALMVGLNIAYNEREQRGFVKLHLIALALTLGGILGTTLLIALVAVAPAVLEALPLPSAIATAIGWLRWPVLVALFGFALAVLYRWGPSRDQPLWRWVSWGAVVGALFWLMGSALFSLYVSNFGNYDATYGSLGAVVIFLLWLYLSLFVVLLGAEFNSEAERQTVRDTTEGPPQPLGGRDAHAADNVGPAPP